MCPLPQNPPRAMVCLSEMFDCVAGLVSDTCMNKYAPITTHQQNPGYVSIMDPGKNKINQKIGNGLKIDSILNLVSPSQ